MTRTILILMPLAVILTACGLLSPEHQQTALQVIDEMVRNGSATPEQAEAMRVAVLSGGQGQWWQSAAEILLGAGLGYLGVRVHRGAPTQRAGLPASKVHPSA